MELSRAIVGFNKFLTENFDSAELKTKFDVLAELYFQVNSVINISAIRNIDDFYTKHLLDSLYPYKLFSGKCCDVGCGGGFPCIPLALATRLDFTAIDGVGKKLELIKRLTAELKINNITPIHIRAEELSRQGVLFDTVCARAVADTDKTISFCAPLAKPGGKIVLYKTQNDEPAAQKTTTKLKTELSQTIDYFLPDTDIKRRVFVYVKT